MGNQLGAKGRGEREKALRNLEGKEGQEAAERNKEKNGGSSTIYSLVGEATRRKRQ